MLLTLSGILTPLVPGGPRCGRGSRLARGLRSVRSRRRRLLLLPRRLRRGVRTARRSSGHVFLRISPDANYHCHISAPESAIKRNDRRCLRSVEGGEKKEETGSQKDGAVQSQIEARNLIRGKNESRTRSMQSKYRGIEKAPDQDLQVSGGQFQGKSQSAIQESLIL